MNIVSEPHPLTRYFHYPTRLRIAQQEWHFSKTMRLRTGKGGIFNEGHCPLSVAFALQISPMPSEVRHRLGFERNDELERVAEDFIRLIDSGEVSPRDIRLFMGIGPNDEDLLA